MISIVSRKWSLTELLVLSIGVLGLLSDFLQRPHYRILNIHVLFGVMLLSTVACELLHEWRSSMGNKSNDYYQFTRRLARRVYALLYIMAAVRLCLYVAGAHSLEDFKIYIAFGAAAICVIRVSAMVQSFQALN